MINYNGNKISKIMHNGVVIKTVMQNGNVLYQSKKPNGIYIQTVDGTLYTKDEWNALTNKPEANGVAVITDDCKFVVSTKESSVQYWGEEGFAIPDAFTTTQKDVAITDYNGESNTIGIRKILGPGTVYNFCPAANWCHDTIFPNGKNGYLPACGELLTMIKNKVEISEYLKLIGGTEIGNTFRWSSTVEAGNGAWSVSYNENVTAKTRLTQYVVRPFCKIE